MNIEIKKLCNHCGGEYVIVEEDEWTNIIYVCCMDCDEVLPSNEYIDPDSIKFYQSIGYKVEG